MLHKIGSVTIFFILIFSFNNLFFNAETNKAKNGNTLFVGGTGFGNYSTIQEAIDNSTDDDTVYVYNGTYYENLVINKSINLIGLDKNFTIIRGRGDLYIILIKSSWVNISGFTLINGKAGVYISESNYSFNNITDNIILNNWEGIRLYNSSSNKIAQNIIKDHSNIGIVLYESNNNLIIFNNFTDNFRAVLLGRWSDNNDISGNNFTENYIGVSLDYSFNNLIYENFISDGNCGISLSYSNNNNIKNNTIKFNDDCGIYLSNSDDNIISLNIFSNNNQDVKIEPKAPGIKAPGFEVLFVICAVLIVLILRKKYLKFKL